MSYLTHATMYSIVDFSVYFFNINFWIDINGFCPTLGGARINHLLQELQPQYDSEVMVNNKLHNVKDVNKPMIKPRRGLYSTQQFSAVSTPAMIPKVTATAT